MSILIYSTFKWAFWTGGVMTRISEEVVLGLTTAELNELAETVDELSYEEIAAIDTEDGTLTYFKGMATLYLNGVDITSESYFSALPFYLSHSFRAYATH